MNGSFLRSSRVPLILLSFLSFFFLSLFLFVGISEKTTLNREESGLRFPFFLFELPVSWRNGSAFYTCVEGVKKREASIELGNVFIPLDSKLLHGRGTKERRARNQRHARIYAVNRNDDCYVHVNYLQ